MKRTPSPIGLISALGALGLIVVWVATQSAEGLFFVTLTTLSFLSLALVFSVRGTQELSNPIALVMFNIGIGVLVRSYYMAFSENREVGKVFTLGRDYVEFLLPTFYVLLGMLVFSLFFYLAFQYQWNKIPARLIGRGVQTDWSEKKAQLLILLFLGISILGLVLFISSMGIKSVLLELTQSSEKRFIEVEGEGYKYAALGYYRWMVSLAQISLYLSLIIYLNKTTNSKKFLLWLILSAALSLFFPFFTSSRSSIGLILFTIMIILSVYRKINFGLVATAGLAGVLMFNYMTQLRYSRWADASDLDNKNLFELFVFNRNLADISKTAHIINGVPEEIEYKYGSSLLSVFVSPIPRTLWPEKPVLYLGKEIGKKIYKVGERVNTGIPPGFIAELFLNFGLLGILSGMGLLGLFLGGLYSAIKHYPVVHDGHILLYAILVVFSAIVILGSSFSQGIIAILQLYLPSWLINKYLSRT